MKRLLWAIIGLVVLSSCGPTYTLYNWGGTSGGATVYEDLSYKSYKTQTPESLCALLVAYEQMVNNPNELRQVPPPGICAEYGYLLLKPETAVTFMNAATNRQKAVYGSADYSALFTAKGKEMLQKEMELYPESVKFIGPLLKKLAR